MASGSNSRGLVLLLITSCFFITGILFDYMPMIIDDHIKRTIELATNEEILTYWKQPPVDVNSYYWLYEISNPEQFQSAGEKAQVRQVGPFHFISRLEKRIIGLSANKFRITYNSTRFMRLNESYSRELLDVPVTLPNPFYTSILEGVRVNAGELDAQSRAVAFGTINRMTERFNESILNRNTTARQALLGREMPIVNKLARMAQTMGMEGRMPELSNSGKYGYVSLTNNSLSGPFEIYTGYQETARSLGELISYKGKRRLNYYDGKCNRMQASVGELRPMPIDPNKRLEMFQPSFCRIIHLEPTGQHKLREGVAVSYALVSDDFASAANNPDNRCFCVNSSGPTSYTMENNRLDDNHCSLDGVIDLGPCSYGAPLLVAPSSVQLDSRIINSLGPAFDPDLLHGEVNEIDMADDKSQVVILKRVGIPIRADITITLFMRLVRDPIFKETANVPEVSYLPLVTVRETVTIPPKLAQIIINLESFISLTYHIKVVMYLSAVVLLFWLSGHYYCITTDNTGRQASQSNEPGSGNGGGGSNGAQLRRATLTSTVLGGGGGGGSGNGSAGGANGLRRGEDPSGQQQTMANGDTHKRSSGQFRSSLTSSASIAAEIRNDDRLTGNPITTAPTNTATTMSGGNRGGPARSSILLASSRALGTVEEVSAGSGGGGGAGSQVGGGVGAGDSTSSERANSADSSRSLPPSRHTSRLGSLSQTSVELEAAESGGQQQQQPRQTGTNGGDAAMNVVGADGGPISSGPDERTTGGGSGGEGNNLRRLKREPTSMMRAPQQQSGGSRIFSKVDEQLGASARGNKVAAASSTIRANPGPIQAGAASIKQKAMNGASAGQPCIGNATGTNPSDSCEGGSGGGVGGVGPNGELSPSSAGQQQQTSAQDSGELAEAAQFGGGRRRKRKNWFMNVYSNLVQMLNGLRSTINDASQLEVNENNDYRDKQLEMLAGKIDNWYNGHDGGGSGGGGPTRPPRPTAAAASANATDAAANDGNEGADAEAEVPTMGPSSNASRGLDTRLMVSPATVAGSSSGSAARQRLAGGAPLPAASSATTGTQTQTDGGDQSEPADRSNGSTNDPGSVAGSVQVNTDTGAAMGQQEDEAPQPRTKGPPTTAAAATTETTTAAAPSQPLASSPSSSSPSAGNGIKESRSDSVKRPRAAGATTDTAELEASSTAAPVAPGVQDPETVSKFRDSSSYAQRRSSTISSAHSPQPTPKDATLASAAAAEPSEANSTERNGLNSRSMRVESSRAIDDGEDSERGAAAGQVATNGRPPPPMMISQQQQQDAPTTRVTPAASGGSETQEGPQSAEAAPDRSKQTAADQQKQQAPTEQKRLQSSELAAAAAHEGASSTASSPPPARSPFESVANGSAGEDETETEPETEAEVEANELDKATTLDRIEAALNGTDEQLLLAAGAAPNGRPSSPPSERPSIDSASSTKGNNNNKVALSKQSSGPPSAVGGAPINSSTASLDSVIDLKTSTAAAGPANKQAPLTNGLNNVGHQLVNQSTTANNGAQQLGPNLAGKRIDGRSGAQQLGGPDKLLELNGLATRGTTTTTATAPVVTTTQTIKASSNGTGPAASITTTTTRPDGAREKLVAIDDDDDDDDRDEGDDGHGDDDYEIEIDRLEQPNSPRQQEGPLEMRTKNSSKSLVSNPLLQSSGREQRRQRLLSSNDDAATNNIVHASADKDAANVNDHGEQYQDEPPAREQAVIGDEDGVSFSSSSSNGSRNGIKNYTPAAAAVASSQVAPSLPLEAGLPETNDCEQRVQPTLQLPRGNSVAANTATRQQISGETDATTTLTTTSTTTMTNSDEQEEEGERTIDGIQSVGSSPAPSSPLASSSVDRSDDSRIVANDPLASQTVVTAAATGAAVTTAGTRPASRLAPINLANNRKQLRQQKEQATRSNAYNGPMRQQQQQQQQPMTQHNEIRAAETNAAARLALIGSNRYDLDDSNGNNILNEKIISHYQSQVARVAAGRQMRVWNAPAVALFIVYTVC